MKNIISVDIQSMKTINFAMQQNYIPLIRSILVENSGSSDIDGIDIKISFEPEFAREFSASVSVPAGKTAEISPVKIVLSAEYLFSLTEKLAGNMHIEAVRDGETLFSDDRQVELLAYDEWSGAMIMPEMISAFVTPNHPKVQELTAKASVYLSKWTGSPSFTGYQSGDPNMVKKQAAAVYAALQEENIAYTAPPASYEKTGQRIRLAHTVLSEKHGTCIDLAVLYASCLEAVDINPIILVIKGHAFAGFWLENETFSECTEDDSSAVTKRIAAGINKICLVECTDYVAGKAAGFETAERHAAAHLENADDFLFAADVQRCRGSGIRAIPTRVAEDGEFRAVDYGKREKKEITDAPSMLAATQNGEAAASELTRNMIWERKLLDLSLRNPLINFRPTGTNVQLMAVELDQLENELNGGEEFKILPMPSDSTFTMSDNRIYKEENEHDRIATIAKSEFRSHRLRTFTKENELEKTLKNLHRQAKVSLEENGANTLYLALGFLRWYETEKSEKARYAPLLLIPVDLVKKIQDKSYSLRVRDEDTQINITLLELLRQDYGIEINGLNPLPTDESGVDTTLIFNIVRQAVMPQKHWDVEEVAFVGQFSFSRFIMWNDLRCRTEELKQNKVVRSLISGRTEWEPDCTELTPEELDEKLAPQDMAIPTSADSSQLAAIYKSAMGESFVLHGPPGTGKSQTITNMIANALFQGKSVLFVAEKMAALSVVQKRLAKIGLDPFCLELHSNKAQKRAVLSQLEQTLAAGHIKSPEEYAFTAEKLHSLRKELNDTMKALYKPRFAGMSVYDAVVKYEAYKKYDGVIHISPEILESADEIKYSCWLEAIRDTAAAGKELGGLNNSPLKNVCPKDYSLEIRESFAADAKKLSELIKKAQGSYLEICKAAAMPMPSDKAGISSSISLLKRISAAENLIPEIILSENSESVRADLESIVSMGLRCSEIYGDISEKFEQSVWGYDSDAALINWKKAQQSWALAKAIGTDKAVKELRLYAKNPQTVTKENITEYYSVLSEYRQVKSKLSAADKSLTDFFGAAWHGENTHFDELKESTEEAFEIRELIGNSVPALCEAAKKAVSDRTLRSALRELTIKSAADFLTMLEADGEMSRRYCADLNDSPAGADYFSEAIEETTGWYENADKLRDRAVLENCITKLSELHLEELAAAYRDGFADENTMTAAFECAASRSLIDRAAADEPLLSKFHGSSFDNTVEKYRNFTKRFEELTIEELAARLSAKIPDVSSGSGGSSELAVLSKAIKSGGRMMPIRKLFDSIPTLLRRICPCMLMSPISVAQYINPSFPKFDLVIFDEASQLPTSEAVGAIARGENVVVVGDPKQLPPTSFFTANQTDEENFEHEDLESVLDDCLALAMPQQHLLWHYRSRHESLIAFSNSKYYDNKLRTFPSPDDLVSKVTWVHVDGSYDKGGSKQNKAEAEAVVAEIARRLSDPVLRRDSIGVVTFSVVQQVLIDDMLADEFRKHPELEQYANEQYEPILVKNLENVQGDERDVILFSIGYGPDKDGKVSMNFGPVNQDGGWRRLNVAISRSRKQMTVYSVIRPEQIDLSRTRSEGVAGLRGFLDFAAKGSSALPVRQDASAKKNDSDAFTKTVADALTDCGYNVRMNVGCSDYKIDIGVIHPDDSSRYVIGIMCENQKTFGLTTARDRNIVQPSVLSGLGWKIANVHILDWLDNDKRALSELKEVIDKAVEDSRNPEAEEPTPEPKAKAPVFEKEEPAAAAAVHEAYIPYKPEVIGVPESYTGSKGTIQQIIKAVAEAEAPVSKKSIYRRTLDAFGIARSNAKAESCFDEVFALCGLKTTERGDSVFVWKNEQNPDDYFTYRTAANGEKRSIEDICTREIAAAVYDVITSSVAVERAELVKETAKLLGFTRTTDAINLAVSQGISLIVKSGKAQIDPDNGKIKLV